MPANLRLLPRQQFIITLSDGTEINGQFGTYATSLFGKKKNLTLTQIYKHFLIEQKDEQGNVLKNDKDEILYDVRIHDMIDFIMCACESAARLKGDRFNLNDPQLCQWVDDYIAESGDTNVLITLYGHSIARTQKKNQEQQEPV